MSRARNLSGLMGTSATLDVNDIADAADLSGVEIYEDSDAQAAAVYIPGRQIYRRDLGAFQIHNGSSWRTIDFTAVAEPILGFQGTNGYVAGGLNGSNAWLAARNTFSMASDGNATVAGDMALAVGLMGRIGNKSSVAGYTQGGYGGPPYVSSSSIQKWTFAADDVSTNIGNMTIARKEIAAASSSVSGYAAGGTSTTPTYLETLVIDKFAFASDGNSTSVGNSTTSHRGGSGGLSSNVSGYIVGGYVSSIEKYSFATDGNAAVSGAQNGTGVGGSAGAGFSAPISSSDYGYQAGFQMPAPTYNASQISKFPFAADGNMINQVGILLTANSTASQATGHSGVTSGYVAGGSPPATNQIQKFAYATDTNATDVGDLTSVRWRATGTQG